MLLIDDVHFADEASLVMLRTLFMRKELSLLVCGTATSTVAMSQDEESPPWVRFVESHGDEIAINILQLEPLREDDIAQHLAGVFPGIDLPDGFEKDLAEITQGNPLFLAEIIRKLVLDQKLHLVGQRWTIDPPEKGYLPRSLDEIVSEKIAALDEQGRSLLEEVSTLGEDVPLSMVTGASDISESKVLEFLDRAEDLGLLRADFHINDETMRFLSKRVLEIVYGQIDQTRRQELHQRVGTYQEGLYDHDLGPSASILAYHFKLSADREKARRYDQIRIDLSQKTFSRDEAESYTGEPLVESRPSLRSACRTSTRKFGVQRSDSPSDSTTSKFSSSSSISRGTKTSVSPTARSGASRTSIRRTPSARSARRPRGRACARSGADRAQVPHPRRQTLG